jgi:hypothetical protein
MLRLDCVKIGENIGLTMEYKENEQPKVSLLV